MISETTARLNRLTTSMIIRMVSNTSNSSLGDYQPAVAPSPTPAGLCMGPA